jgi:hypothetical protein
MLLEYDPIASGESGASVPKVQKTQYVPEHLSWASYLRRPLGALDQIPPFGGYVEDCTYCTPVVHEVHEVVLECKMKRLCFDWF